MLLFLSWLQAIGGRFMSLGRLFNLHERIGQGICRVLDVTDSLNALLRNNRIIFVEH